MKVYDSKGNPVQLGDSVGRGGEATVYQVLARPHWLAKIYEPAPRHNYDRKLTWMVDHPPLNPTRAQEHPSIAWPVGLLYQPDKRLAGYLMPYIQVAVPVLEVFNPRRRAEIFPQFDRRYLHRVARNLAAALSALHRTGYVAGDLNESNVMVTPRSLVTLIDADSFQVEEKQDDKTVFHPCPVGKYEYTPPELQGQAMGKIHRKPEHDAFGLGVLIFQLLMEGNHPFRAQWLGAGDPPAVEKRIAMGGFPYMASPPCPVLPPKNAPAFTILHPAVAELVRRCFADGHQTPALRPSPSAWEKALAEAEEALVACAKEHLYSSHLRACPFCTPGKVEEPSPRKAIPTRKREEATETALPRWQASRQPAWAQPWPTKIPAPAPAAAAPQPASTPLPRAANPHQAISPRPWRVKTASKPLSPFARSRKAPGLRQLGLRKWAQPRIYKSFAVGGSLGALSGALFGSLVGVATWSAGEAAAWSLLCALGGAAAGTLRGWLPGFRLSQGINRYIGWNHLWQFAGMITGAMAGSLVGLVFGLAVFPICIGFSSGAILGGLAGRSIWVLGNRLGWERIWGVFGALFASLLGWRIAVWAAASGFGQLADRFAVAAGSWIMSTSSSWALAWLIMGAVGGALGGAVAGILVDLFARLSGLVD